MVRTSNSTLKKKKKDRKEKEKQNKTKQNLGMEVHSLSPRTSEAEVGGSL